jgi:hypothetical protein
MKISDAAPSAACLVNFQPIAPTARIANPVVAVAAKPSDTFTPATAEATPAAAAPVDKWALRYVAIKALEEDGTLLRKIQELGGSSPTILPGHRDGDEVNLHYLHNDGYPERASGHQQLTSLLNPQLARLGFKALTGSVKFPSDHLGSFGSAGGWSAL